MSNAEFIEELMHKAHKKGFFTKMHGRVDNIIKSTDGIQRVDAYYKAYKELKAEKKAEKKKIKI